jgi:uncharacterized protein (UPF0332 family)
VKAKDLMAKATQAAASAKLLLDTNDTDGACNRAYYAMFDAARAALLHAGVDIGKTHSGVLAAFSEHFVQQERVTKDMGRLLKHAETVRYVADYQGEPVGQSDAKDIVEQAMLFVGVLRELLASDGEAGV